MLEVRGVSKQFPAVRALDGVSLQFKAGHVHGLIGENGAGKSTLMKILSGIEQPTEGHVLLEGQEVHLNGPGEAMARGIVMIHQELNLVDELTVAENIFLGREIRKGLGLDRAQMLELSRGFLSEVRAPFGPEVYVGGLSIAQKQLVEIAKAISHKAKYLIMDEPTAVLSEREIEALFTLIRGLKEQGVGVIYISHLLREVLTICDEVSILRDGKFVESRPSAGSNPATLASLMVGRDLGDVYPEKATAPIADPILKVSNLEVSGVVRGVSFELRPGELVGLAGLIGSGRTETAEAIVGLRPSRGQITINGQQKHLASPKEAIAAGVAYVSEDRKGAGLHLTMSTVENATLANLSAYANPVVDRAKEKAAVQSWIEKLGIRVGDPEAAVLYLSGGNQQKVSLAKWLDGKPKVLLLDEPTRGVDVGAKREIYQLIAGLASEGLACLVISSEMTELIGLCHRVMVMREGRIVGELSEAQLTEEAIMHLAAGVDA
jgi:ribose transport system ATP-binding protein